MQTLSARLLRLSIASIDIGVRVSNASLHEATCLPCFVCILQQKRGKEKTRVTRTIAVP